MSAIFGSTYHYEAEVLSRKMEIASFRGREYSDLKQYSLSSGLLSLGYNSQLPESTAHPHQPYQDKPGLSVVFDGEISNKKSLKAQFSLSEDVLSNISIICFLYKKFGNRCVEYINGGYAFVIYDAERQLLFGARDRMGLKPLFYHCDSDGFEFASQLFPLCIGKAYHINPVARQYYFALQYIPEPISIISEVSKLRAGQYFEYSLVSGKLALNTYWDIHDNTCQFEVPKTYGEAVEIAEGLIEDSVANLMDNKPNICTFLSGGIDSSLITAITYKQNPDVEAFSMGFSENQFDESEYSKKVADILGIKYNHVVCTTDQALGILENLQLYYDEPMGDASAIPTSLLAQMAKKTSSVALGGDGGDEVFFGYPRYLRYASREWVYKTPLQLRNCAAKIAGVAGKRRLALSLRLKSIQDLYINRRVYCPAEKFDALSLQQSMDDYHYLTDEPDIRKAFNDYDMKTLMVNAYNVKTERATARVGLEFYTPLLDYRLAEFSRNLPVEYLYSPEYGQKRILRSILDKYFPREIFERKKRGFGVPLASWFRNELKDYLIDTLNENSICLLPEYDSKKMIEMRDNHISGKNDYQTYMWLCVNYLEWYRLFENLNK